MKSKPTEQEIASLMTAYSVAPWGEDQDYNHVKSYLSAIYANPSASVKVFQESPKDPPYLYCYSINYNDNIQAMIEKEFLGEHAYWRTLETAKINNALRNCKNVTYISNIHADKNISISASKKPRLKVFPKIIEKLFFENLSDSIVLMTHRTTGVYQAVMALDKYSYHITFVDYHAKCTMTKFNASHKIDYLSLVVITKQN